MQKGKCVIKEFNGLSGPLVFLVNRLHIVFDYILKRDVLWKRYGCNRVNMCVSRWSSPFPMATTDMLLSQRKKKTWQCFDGKGSKVILRVVDREQLMDSDAV